MTQPEKRPLMALRSHLFVPATSERKLVKAMGTQADALVIDLEDSVANAEKYRARSRVAELLSEPQPKPVFVRVNGLETQWCWRDLQAIVSPNVQGIILPKMESAEAMHTVDWVLGQLERENGLEPRAIRTLPIVETAKGIAAVSAIAGAAERTLKLCFGAVDLASDMSLDISSDEGAIQSSRYAIAVASRVAGLMGPKDTAYIQIGNLDGLAASAARAKAMGYTGKGCIHPDQIEVVNTVFSSTSAEVDRARKIVSAFKAAEASGAAAVKVDGVMVDYPVVSWAQQVLAQQAAG